MAISTYAELKQAVADWLKRTDLTTYIPDFIALAESDHRHDVKVREMESLAAGTLTGETLAHPTRMIEARRLVVADYQRYYVPAEVYQQYDKDGRTDKVYTNIGASFYILNGASGDSYSLIYTAGFTPLSASGDKNWLLTNAPEVYLFGALRHAAAYTVDEQNAARFKTLYGEAVARVNGRENAARSAGPLSILPAVSE